MNDLPQRSREQLQAEVYALRLKNAELEAFRSRYDIIAAKTVDGICILNDQGQYLEANPSFCSMIGYSEAEIQKMSVLDIDILETVDTIKTHVATIKTTGADRFESKLRTKKGNILDCDLTVQFIDECQTQIIAFVRDMTLHKERERQLQETHDLNAALFNAITETVFAIDLTGIVVAANTTCADRFGIPREEFIGSNIRKLPTDIVSKDIQTHRWDHVEKVIETQQAIRFVAERQERFFDTSFYPVTNEQSDVTHIVIYAQEITKQKRQESMLQESEEKYRTLINSASEEISVVDSTGMLSFVNERVAERFGLPQDSFIGKNMKEFLPPEYGEQHVKMIQQVIETNHSVNIVTPTEINGQYCWFDITIVPIEPSKTSPPQALFIARDITDLRLAQESLESFRKQMVFTERLTSVGTLSAMAAHEMAQPLTVARLSVQNALVDLKSQSAGQDTIELLEECIRGLDSATDIVSRFRSFARIQPKRHHSKINLYDLFHRVIELVANGSRKARLHIDAEQLKSIPSCKSYQKDLEQLAYILIENSIQASDGQSDYTLKIQALLKEDTIILEFTDDCGGIPEELESRIFDPFFTTKTHAANTGLGLCVADHIAHSLEGSIKLTNRVPEGVTFHLRLPYSQV